MKGDDQERKHMLYASSTIDSPFIEGGFTIEFGDLSSDLVRFSSY